jgi:hypothetical protein
MIRLRNIVLSWDSVDRDDSRRRMKVLQEKSRPVKNVLTATSGRIGARVNRHDWAAYRAPGAQASKGTSCSNKQNKVFSISQLCCSTRKLSCVSRAQGS